MKRCYRRHDCDCTCADSLDAACIATSAEEGETAAGGSANLSGAVRRSSAYVSCRVLLAAGPEAGQEHVAGALLCLLDGCAVHTVSLPALLTAGALSQRRP